MVIAEGCGTVSAGKGIHMTENNKTYRLLAINPGSTSTKISLFENDTELFEKSIFHDAPELLHYAQINDQLPFRCNVIMKVLEQEHVDISTIDAFVGRGGSAYSQRGGVIRIDQRLYNDTEKAVGGSDHPAKLGVMLAWEFAKKYGGQAFTLNPTNVDEYCDYARLTGIRGVYRYSHSHVLNQKAVAEYHAKALGKRYEDCNFIVAHIDGGITVSAHEHGRMIDGNMGADGDGAFTPTRIGSLPVLTVLDYLETHTIDEVRLLTARSGGFVGMFGTSNSDTVHEMVEKGDPKAVLVWNTLAYQVSKMIGEMSAVLCGKAEAILLTGGLMRFKDLSDFIEKHCGWIAPITIYPGEMEQQALALSALQVLRGEREAHTYTGKPVWTGFPGIEF